jgi:hypothetical protein
MTNEEIQKAIDEFAIHLFGMTTKDAQDKGICIQCKRPALDHCYSQAGKREFYISGLCEECFDRIDKE